MDYEHVKKQLGYGIQTESKDNAIKALEQLQAKVAELEKENARLIREVVNRNQRALDGDKAVKAADALYEQPAAAREEIERLNGQISVYRLSFVELERQRDVEMTSATRWGMEGV